MLTYKYRHFIHYLYKYWVSHPSQFAIVVILFGIVYGQLGSSLGVPSLFWNEVPKTRGSASLGATLVLGLLGIIAFYLIPKESHEDTIKKIGEFLKDDYSGWPPIDKVKAKNAWELSRFLRLVRLPFLSLLALPAFLPGAFPTVPRYAPVLADKVVALGAVPEPAFGRAVLKNPDVDGNPLAWLIGLPVWLVGIGLGVLIIKLGIHVSPLSDKVIRRLLERFKRAKVGQRLGDPGRRSPEKEASIFTFFMIVIVFYIFLNTMIYDWVSPAFAICALLGLLAIGCALLALVRATIRLLIIGFAFVWIGVCNHDEYRLKFENINTYQSSKKTTLDSRAIENYYSNRDPKTGKPRPESDPINTDYDGNQFDESGELASNDDALDNWKTFATKGKDFNDPNAKPKLVVICVTGGASRSAYWTLTVLDRLEKKIPRFSDNIRIICGASGGMVGASYYVKWLNEHRCDEAKKDEEFDFKFMDRTLPYNSLTPVARYIALCDIWKALLPGERTRNGRADDRGAELEGDWAGIQVPFTDFRELERRGRLPSLIFSPMTVEDGRRLLISNLDLRRVACRTNGGEWAHPPAKEYPPRALAFSAGAGPFDADPKGEALSSLSFSAIEFFKLFPGQAANGFRISTAARMSATFPFVSPVVNLPTDPSLRVVDAGYYDNYGIDVAADWLFQNREWIAANCSGVALIQIRDSISRDDRLGYRDAHDGGVWSYVSQGFDLFFGVRDAFMKARESSTMFRNDGEVAALGEVFSLMTQDRSFFASVIFENSANVSIGGNQVVSTGCNLEGWPVAESDRPIFEGESPAPQTQDVAMSWYLTEAERLAILNAIPIDPVDIEKNCNNNLLDMLADYYEKHLKHLRIRADQFERNGVARSGDPEEDFRESLLEDIFPKDHDMPNSTNSEMLKSDINKIVKKKDTIMNKSMTDVNDLFPAWRRVNIAQYNRWSEDSKPKPSDPWHRRQETLNRRAYLFRQFERARNYDRLHYLAEWWNKPQNGHGYPTAEPRREN
jgi:hypothetical protein